MKKWIFAAALLAGGNANVVAETCPYTPPKITPLPSIAISSQRLVLAGPAVIELGLAQTPETLAHGPGLLIAKYENGAVLSHRELQPHELRFNTSSSLTLPAYIRLLFLQDVEGATDLDRQEALMQRVALRFGCDVVAHHLVDGLDVFSYSQTRSGGDRYHAYFILSEGVVHYLDVVGTDAFARRVISTLKKRRA
jgi:hypothetical protein